MLDLQGRNYNDGNMSSADVLDKENIIEGDGVKRTRYGQVVKQPALFVLEQQAFMVG